MKLREKYRKDVIPAMRDKFGYKSVMAVPRIEKVVINTGIGRLVAGKTSEEQKKLFNSVLEDLAAIAGQKAVLTKVKKSISVFKVRQGTAVGAKVCLRGKRMYDFLERLINIAFPRVRDFRGIGLKSFDPKGNLTVAFKEQSVFPEISPERTKAVFGFEITIVTTAKSREQSIELLRLMGFPLKHSSERPITK
ncbi:50S ribosomal protein L5 [Parcubacteria bacterium DG_72]|nr:MAG: 50S ribosomal protein L5 [Parcubacteria bacterium DG_72]